MAEQLFRKLLSNEHLGRAKQAGAVAVTACITLASAACGPLFPEDHSVPRDIVISGFWDPTSCANASKQPGAEHFGFDAAFRKEIEAQGYTHLTPMPDNSTGLAWKYETTAINPEHPGYGSPRVDVVANGNIVLPKQTSSKHTAGICSIEYDIYTAQTTGPMGITNAHDQTMPTAGEVAQFLHQATTESLPDGATAYTITAIARPATQANVALAA